MFTDVGDIKERFVYDTNIKNPSFSEVVQVLDELDDFAVQHRYLNGPELDQVFSDQTADGSIFWLLQDNQQTVTDVATFGDSNNDGGADGKATLINHLTYNAFGQVIKALQPAMRMVRQYGGNFRNFLMCHIQSRRNDSRSHQGMTAANCGG